MQYIELVEKSVTNRNNIISVSELKIFKANYERYISHYRFNDEIVEHIKNTGSVREFSGKVTINYIWVDFDNKEDVDKAKSETIKFLNNIALLSELPIDSFPVFFSGNKGFHVGINAKLLDINNAFSVDLPGKIREFIKKLTKEIDFIDYSIYDKTRIIRLPQSLNEKSGLYKIYLPFEIFEGYSIKAIKNCAKDCKIFPRKKYEYVLNQQLCVLFNTKEEVKVTVKKTSSSIFKIPSIGERNKTLYNQALRLYYESNLKSNEISDIMHLIYRLTKIETNNKDFLYREFSATLNSAFKYARKNKAGGLNIRPIDDLTYSVIDMIKNSKYIPTTIDEIDIDLDGGLVIGNVYSIIGKGGTKKSLFAMWIGIKNCMSSGIPVAYFNMEMSTTQSFLRAYQMLFNKDIKNDIKDGKFTEQDIENMSKEFNSVLKNKFFLIDNNNLLPSDMIEAINEIKETYKEDVKLIVVDSMNSMATIGNSETFTAFEATKQLKQIAKEKECVVIIVNHVTQACLLHVRDTSLYVRGGAKVIDNCDAYFCLSMCVDKANSTLVGEDKDFVYLNDIVYCRFVNKRETGSTIDKVLEVGSDLILRTLDISPKKYELFYKERQ